ncbi:MAG: hypothetical protein JXR18_13620 [Neptuniibacter sp.]
MYRNSHFRIQGVWCLIVLLVTAYTFSQSSTLHLHIDQAHDHHGGLHSHAHAHAHGRYILDAETHKQNGVELKDAQLLLISKIQFDSFLFVVGSILVLLCLTRQGRLPVTRRKTEPIISSYSIPPPPRAPPQETI